MLGAANGTFQAAQIYAIGDGLQVYRAVLGDFDGDGFDDVAVTAV